MEYGMSLISIVSVPGIFSSTTVPLLDISVELVAVPAAIGSNDISVGVTRMLSMAEALSTFCMIEATVASAGSVMAWE